MDASVLGEQVGTSTGRSPSTRARSSISTPDGNRRRAALCGLAGVAQAGRFVDVRVGPGWDTVGGAHGVDNGRAFAGYGYPFLARSG